MIACSRLVLSRATGQFQACMHKSLATVRGHNFLSYRLTCATVMPLAEIILITAVLLILAMIVAGLRRQLLLPYTVLLVLLGMLVDQVSPYFAVAEQVSKFHITTEIVFFLFLPALIFESALSLDARALLMNIIPILVLAIPGMLVSTFLVGTGVWYSLQIHFMSALLFGALISATDPVAVIELFKELGAPRRLTVLVEGESLMNDATAIVLFNLLLALIVKGEFSAAAANDAVFDFFRVFVGGILVGAMIGMLLGELMSKLHSVNPSILIVLSLTAAYASFIVAEHEFQVSGVMSVLTAAICLNIFGVNRLTLEATKNIHATWDFIVLICNSLLFILIGLSVEPVTLFAYWQPVLTVVAAVFIARAVSVYLFVPLTTRGFALPKVSLGDQHIMWWGGLKGGLAIAIVMTIPESMPERGWLIELTLGVVLISLLVSGSTLRPLIRWLKIDALNDDEKAELEQCKVVVDTAINSILHDFSNLNLLGREMQKSIKQRLALTLTHDVGHLSEEQRLNQIHLQALQAEEDELEYLYEIGLVNYYVYATFKDIIRRDRELSFIDLQNARHDVGFENIFLRMENRVIDFLVKKDWLHGLLVRYQNMRFANQVRHDIAGILMAHAALKAIKNDRHQGIDEKKLAVIKAVYQRRLSRRQSKLKSFANNYPEYFQQYQSLLFLQAALRHAMKLLAKDNAVGKISNKVYARVQCRLQEAVRHLPVMKASLSLYRRDTWLAQVPLFTGLPEALLQELARYCRYINFLPGDTVFHENDKGYALYILVKGRVDVYRKDEHGVDRHLAELREGSLIGVHALLAEQSRRSATVKAKTYITLLKLTAADVLRLAKESPELERRLRQADLML